MKYTANLYFVFVDFYKTLDSVNRSKKLLTVKKYGNPAHSLIILSYDGFTYQVVNEGRLPALQKNMSGVRQGRVLSPTILLMIVDEVTRKLYKKTGNILTGVSQNNLKNYILHVSTLFHTFANMGKKLR
jgi:hypothetical protein